MMAASTLEREGLLPTATASTPSAHVVGTAVMSWNTYWYCFFPSLLVLFALGVAFFPPLALALIALGLLYVSWFVITFPFFRNGFQLWALQRPNNLLARLLMPLVEHIEGWRVGVATATLYTQVKNGGGNFCAAGQVWLTSHKEVAAALTNPQARTFNLGEHPLLPKTCVDSKSGRCAFLLALSDKGATGNGDHEAFRAAMQDYFFNDEARTRERDDVAKRLYDELEKDYKEVSDFYENEKRGNRVFWMKYLHYVLLGLDVENQSVVDTLKAVHVGNAQMNHYLSPGGHAPFFNYATQIEKVCDLYAGSPALRNFKENDPKYNGLTKHELCYLMVAIIRLAGVQGSHFYTWLLTSGGVMGFCPVDVRDYWDSLDLNDERDIRRYILEVGRLSPPVTISHRVATEPFTTEIQGKKYTFPAGVKVAIPIVLANVDKEFWGEDTFSFNHRRPKLEESYMNFNSVGGKHAGRECPAKDLVLRSQTSVLQVLGVGRPRKPYPGPSPPVTSLPARPGFGLF